VYHDPDKTQPLASGMKTNKAERGLGYGELTLKFWPHVGLKSDCCKRQTARKLLSLQAVRWTVWD
jgi:hypothetical protein